MKYKLLRNLPNGTICGHTLKSARAGTVFDFISNESGERFTLIEGDNIEGIASFVKMFGIDNDFFEPITTQAFDGSIWRGEGYYIESDEPIDSIDRIAKINKRYLFESGEWNCFATEKQAQAFDKRMQALARLKKWQAINDNGWIPDWKDCDQVKSYMVYDWEEGFYKFNDTCRYMDVGPDFPYMSCEEVARLMIVDCVGDLEIYFNIV